MIRGERHPRPANEQAGTGSVRLLVLIASALAGLTLMASSTNTGKKDDGTIADTSCGYGPIQTVTNAAGAVVACQREILVRKKCRSCTSSDVSAGVDCSCQTTCVGGGAFQPGIISTGTCTNQITNCVTGTLSAPWRFIGFGAGGKRCYVKTEILNFTNQCVFPNATPCSY